ncbi:hypothetical protein O6H91_Y220400 [Diphasiastrum complanatum]|nr:hypothetical protein O6H91_Y220400 [Diphasiastrum complanatum]
MAIAASSGSGFNVDAFNDAAYSQWEGTLEQCPICDRTFRPEAFQRHNKSCTVEHPAKKAGTGLTAASLSNKIQPGLISGTQHSAKGKAELKPGDQVLGNKVQVCQNAPSIRKILTSFKFCDTCKKVAFNSFFKDFILEAIIVIILKPKY